MFALLGQVANTLFGWFKEKSQAKHERNMAAIELEKRLLLSKQEANSQWEIAQLKDKDKIIRLATFLIFVSPMLAGIFSYSWGLQIQKLWHLLEPWQIEVVKGVCLAVFGMRPAQNLVGSLVGAVKQGLK